jgi:hypothetical protein
LGHSYQSAIGRWKFLLLAALLMGAKPYEDTRQRFTVALPSGWALAPRFGDLFGMTFEKVFDLDGVRGKVAFTVHADPVVAEDLPEFADRVEAEWSRDTKSARVSSKGDRVGPHRAVVREYALEGRGGVGRARSFAIEAAGRRYHLRIEAPGATLRPLEGEIRQLLDGFRPQAIAEAAALEPPRLAVEGSWIGPGGVRLELREDGGFSLGAQHGRWHSEGSTLELSPKGKKKLRFEAALAADGATLSLRSPRLPQPAIYRRAAAPAGAAGVPPLPGRWSAEGPQGAMVLVLSDDGAFRLGPLEGRWSVRGDRLTLAGAKGERVIYRFELDPSGLRLTGGDLDAALLFHRLPDE